MTTFHTNGLLSKWGFGDGDMLDDLLDWAGYDHNTRTHFTHDDEYGPTMTFPHTVLVAAVAAYLVPQIDQRVDLDVCRSIHNPVRARRVDGKEVEYPEDPSIELTPATIEVPDETILALARALALP